MQKVLVTGGAGALGRLLAPQLKTAGYSVRGMSRRANPGGEWQGAEWVQADLETGSGLKEAVQGIDVIIHAATGGNYHTWEIDVEGTRRLLEAAREAGVKHVVFISIVGIDRVPYAVGKAKLAVEEIIQNSGIPWSILRATQFHSIVDTMMNMFTKIPLVALVPSGLLIQPISGEEVARKLVEIVQAGPSGRLPDMGGPQVYTSGELARLWLKQRGMHRAIIPLWLPGQTASKMREGGNTCPQQTTGKVTWEAWLRHHYPQQT